VQVDLLENT